MYRLLRALLFFLPAETAHHAGLWVLSLLEGSVGLARLLRRRAGGGEGLAITVAGLKFPNPIGLAAGFDKDAQAVTGLFALGFGSVEVGTVTPRPQPGNEPPRLFRLPEHRALINRMGFNNQGAAEAAARLRELPWRPGPVGVNIGKNRDTPLGSAVDDYLACVDALGQAGDYLVVNASSPNTPGLRSLQEPEALFALLTAVRARLDRVAPGKPLFLKIAPDLALEAVDAIVDVALACRVDGLIATNTTVTRPLPGRPEDYPSGGLSGAPVRELSTTVIRRAFLRSGGKLPIIGAGGVFTAEDAYEKILAGASLVQVYTGFVYEGPGLVRRLLRGLADLLARDGFSSVAEAVGAQARASSSPPAAPSP
ncbi:MAG: quinone-dependent dihydroorotate dehydrogenase [Myxococcaceae bacterium]